MPRRISIFDTTLRDGEQGAGTNFSAHDKQEIARLLDAIGVDVIEAGFPAASRGSFDCVATIAGMTHRARVCALARGALTDVEAALQAVAPAGSRGRVHIFIATDAKHMAVKLRLTPREVIEKIRYFVSYAKQSLDDVEFSPEVATTTDRAFLYESVAVTIEAGATTINLPDTTGHALPHEYACLFKDVRRHVPAAHTVTLSAHCHDDRGLATANTLAAVKAGAGQVECTINGIGERAGNTALEEVVMALSLRSDYYRVRHDVTPAALTNLSRLVARASGIVVPPNKAFVGGNAFSHASGIHQSGTLRDSSLYEICDPEQVGGERRLPLGKLSGKAGVQAALNRLGISTDEIGLLQIYEEVVRQAEVGTLVDDDVVRGIAEHCQ